MVMRDPLCTRLIRVGSYLTRLGLWFGGRLMRTVYSAVPYLTCKKYGITYFLSVFFYLYIYLVK